ncbi:MAG: hypothetical protein KBF42_07505 [Chitinophagales bacterium]|jgi:hypothetical protein|nr:hypothetical protein [Bacteroidota bacterium]MBK7568162.1 hypothetical protein [Bacteroidota bacterium]MBP8754921.1 hypothetical protein [Chitinophagales bacterium]MBP9221212.1 hypothetical protein [Chitinophagales bacterium]MBP9795612.1 hypothetical protein [Chitinophagales bacterium]
MKLIAVKTTCITAFAIALLFGCKKERADTDIYASLDNSIADASFNDLQAVVNQQAAENGFAGLLTETYGKVADDCPTTTFSAPLGEFPNTMTIDFGESCVSYLGLERSGIVMATFSGPYSTAGTVITVTTENYFVNGNKVEGTKTVTNDGLNDDGNIIFSVTVVDGLITLETGETISWDATRTREWREGEETLALEDDIYAISDGIGADFAASGINRNGVAFTTHIAEPLVKEMDCIWIVSGILEVTPEGLTTRELDFGDGACDNDATLTIGEFTTDITLPY